MDIVFLRHGTTEINKKGCYCGWNESSLAPEGVKEIQFIKDFIDISYFDCIYVSPLRRTIQTTEILGNDYIIDDRLREINFGVFEGLSYKEAYELYPEECKFWERDYINYKLPEGESLSEVFERTNLFIKEVSKKHKRVLVVTHGGVIKCALSEVFGTRDYFYKFKVNHGSISAISINEGFKFIKAINCFKSIKDVLD